MYRFLDPSVHSVAFSVYDFGLIPIYDVVERDDMICDCWWYYGDTYQEGARQVDGVLPTLPHLWQPVRPETERRMAVRQTVPTKDKSKPKRQQ